MLPVGCFPDRGDSPPPQITLRHRHHMFQEVPGLSGYQHTFLIRHPAKAVASLYKASRNTTLTGWTYFDEAEAGFQDLYDLHQAVSREGRCSPVVVDCDDVLAQPEEMMQAYCRAVGLTYKEGAAPCSLSICAHGAETRASVGAV